jgi:hypothetical protein
MIDQRRSGVGESTITVKWWGILLVFICVFGFFFIQGLAQDRRITTLETQFLYITKSIDEVYSLTKQIRDDQVKRYEKYEAKN